MRVLEARFHPRLGSPFLIVAHLVWPERPSDAPAVVQPAPSLLLRAGAGTFLSKVEYLVRATAPDCFHRLQCLRSRFWSFVEVAPAMPNGSH
jgi:hypothetical protein